MATKPATKKTVKKPSVKKAAVEKAPAKGKGKSLYTFNESMKLFRRAAKVIPGGIYGHQSPALTVPGEFPYYVQKAKGCRYWDVDGNEIIDYMCGYGPMVIGYQNDVVDKAADKQRGLAHCTNHPTPLQVELAERLVKLVPFADWAVFAKNGSDVTTWATMVAREYTKKKKILAVKGEYHGAHAWCTPGHGGVIEEDTANIHRFTWNDLDSLYALNRKYQGQVAAIIMTPYHHPAFGDSVMPDPGFWEGVRRFCDQEGIVLILDDVRAGFRLSIKGSQDYFGFDPDISCYCKAIANGYSISAAVGRKELKNCASNVFLTGSYWNSGIEMAAALATIDYLEKNKGVEKMLETGTMLAEGLIKLGESHGFQIKFTGPPSIPYVRFANEDDFYRMQIFSAEVSKRGSFLHPHHNWFISTAHTKKDIDETLNHCDEAFKVLKKSFDF